MKTVFITGANKGIGFETAKQFAQKDYYVYLGSRDIGKGIQAISELNNEGLQNVETIEIDVSNDASIEKASKTLEEKISKLDILINNAGIRGDFPQYPSTANVGMIRKVYNTNLFGTIKVIQSFLPLLKLSPAPRIVNITSGLASLTLHNDPGWKYYPIKGAAYGPSKTALNAYTIALAYELRDTPFKVNVVDPGYTATDFNQHRRTKDVSEAAAFIIKYATIGDDGPSGKYFSDDNNPLTFESPW
ncbi:SDR family oxidoreductase [Ginsengibacter hankyongi]|uniref:SDR family oxidoreductase n=1 Tax=Ginsengibacter hankyongi TaxID=2607284 RepID=A0A5J5IEA2_9BACT|nr:SDR family oxidoreductase [Ginsengibacter hankyongi]KAA9037178.1 SDR family oxidoreductase [Ginsengibacter hankyongi]